jgi:cell division septum initiation protein DivIVA
LEGNNVVDTNTDEFRRLFEPYMGTSANGHDLEEIYSFISSLIDQNAELAGKIEDLNSRIKLLEDSKVEVYSQEEFIASDIEKEANRKASAIISEAENRAAAIILEAENRAKLEMDRIRAEAERKIEDTKQEQINMAIQEGQVITQKAIEMAGMIEARAREEAKKIMAAASDSSEYSQKEMQKISEKETKNKPEGESRKAHQRTLPTRQKPEKINTNPEVRGGIKGIVKYYWNMEIEQQQHNIEILLNTVLGIFATGGGRLLVDGRTVLNWGRNPFTLIPKGQLEFEVVGRRALIKAKGTTSNHPVLVLGNQEIPPIISKS